MDCIAVFREVGLPTVARHSPWSHPEKQVPAAHSRYAGTAPCLGQPDTHSERDVLFFIELLGASKLLATFQLS